MARNCKRNNDCPQGKKCVNGTCSSGDPNARNPPGAPRQGPCGPNTTLINGACVPNSPGTPTGPPAPPPPGGGPPKAPPAVGAGCKYVCGEAAIAAEHARIDAKLAQSQADQAQFQTAQGQWQTTLAGQNAAIAQHLPHYQPPRAPSQPGGYSPGQYQVSTMPAGGTTQAPPSGNQTPTPTPAPTPTPRPNPLPGAGGNIGSWFGTLTGHPAGQPGAQTTPAATQAPVSTYAPGAGFTSWQDYLKQTGQG